MIIRSINMPVGQGEFTISLVLLLEELASDPSFFYSRLFFVHPPRNIGTSKRMTAPSRLITVIEWYIVYKFKRPKQCVLLNVVRRAGPKCQG